MDIIASRMFTLHSLSVDIINRDPVYAILIVFTFNFAIFGLIALVFLGLASIAILAEERKREQKHSRYSFGSLVISFEENITIEVIFSILKKNFFSR